MYNHFINGERAAEALKETEQERERVTDALLEVDLSNAEVQKTLNTRREELAERERGLRETVSA